MTFVTELYDKCHTTNAILLTILVIGRACILSVLQAGNLYP